MFSRMAARTSMPCLALWLTPSSGPRVWLEVGRVQTRRRALSMAAAKANSACLLDSVSRVGEEYRQAVSQEECLDD